MAAGTFLAGLPLVIWLAPHNAPVAMTYANITNDATTNRPVAQRTESVGVASPDGRLIARRVITEEEGVSHTEIVSVDAGAEELIESLPFCFPVAWSPVDANVLLLHEAAADDDERNFAINVRESADHRAYVGCRHCRFRNWSRDRDAILFDCENGVTRILNASGQSPVTAAPVPGPSPVHAAFGG